MCIPKNPFQSSNGLDKRKAFLPVIEIQIVPGLDDQKGFLLVIKTLQSP
jgi:hypothetical protein